jgi:hypothetical protein
LLAQSNFIVFYNRVVKVSDGINASGTTVKIQKPGIYLVSGEAEEGNIIVQSNQVSLYLQNLKLSSEKQLQLPSTKI